MRIIADENISGSIIRALRESGRDVLAIAETMPGASDPDVLARTLAERRILITNDKDFGELAFRRGLPTGCGVILLRLSDGDPRVEAVRVTNILQSRSDWAGHFSVVDNEKIRMRPLAASFPKELGEGEP